MRAILPRSATGLYERLIEERWGRDAVEMIRVATAAFPLPLPLAGAGAFGFRGELYPVIGGGGFDTVAELEGKTAPYDRQTMLVDKSGVAGGNSAGDTFYSGNQPEGGVVGSALPGGQVRDISNPGAVKFQPPASGKRLHLAGWAVASNTDFNAGGIAVLYDRLWDAPLTMNSTAAQPATGVPTRYTGTAAKGNMMWVLARSTLAATAHNHTLTYVDDAGNAAETTVVTGVSGCQSNRMDMAQGGVAHIFAPLNAGDLGVRNITEYQSSAAVATGTMDIVIGRPLAMLPLMPFGDTAIADVPLSLFNMALVEPDACLSFAILKGNSGGGQGPRGTMTLIAG